MHTTDALYKLNVKVEITIWSKRQHYQLKHLEINISIVINLPVLLSVHSAICYLS